LQSGTRTGFPDGYTGHRAFRSASFAGAGPEGPTFSSLFLRKRIKDKSGFGRHGFEYQQMMADRAMRGTSNKLFIARRNTFWPFVIPVVSPILHETNKYVGMA